MRFNSKSRSFLRLFCFKFQSSRQHPVLGRFLSVRWRARSDSECHLHQFNSMDIAPPHLWGSKLGRSRRAAAVALDFFPRSTSTWISALLWRSPCWRWPPSLEASSRCRSRTPSGTTECERDTTASSTGKFYTSSTISRSAMIKNGIGATESATNTSEPATQITREEARIHIR